VLINICLILKHHKAFAYLDAKWESIGKMFHKPACPALIIAFNVRMENTALLVRPVLFLVIQRHLAIQFVGHINIMIYNKKHAFNVWNFVIFAIKKIIVPNVLINIIGIHQLILA